MPASLRSWNIMQKAWSSRGQTAWEIWKLHHQKSSDNCYAHTWISLKSIWTSISVLSPTSSADRDLMLLNWMPIILFSTTRSCSWCTNLTSSFGKVKKTCHIKIRLSVDSIGIQIFRQKSGLCSTCLILIQMAFVIYI